MRRLPGIALTALMLVGVGAPTACGTDSAQSPSQESIDFLNTTPAAPNKGSLSEIENTRWIAAAMTTDGKSRPVPDVGAEFSIDTLCKLSLNTG